MGAKDKANPTGEARAAHLLAWWNEGAGGKIQWGVPGDFMRCVTLASKHMRPDQAKGFCANRHKQATGARPGQAPAERAIAAGKKAAKKIHKAEVPAAWVDAAGAELAVHRLDSVRFEVRPGPELVVIDGDDQLTVTKALVTVPASSRGRIVAHQGDGAVAVEVGPHRAVFTPDGLAVSAPDGAVSWHDPGDVLIPEIAARVHQWFGKARRPVNPLQGGFDELWDEAKHPRGEHGRFSRITVKPSDVKPGDRITAHWTNTGPETAREVTAVTFDDAARKLGHPVDARLKVDGVDVPQFLAHDHPIEVERPDVAPPTIGSGGSLFLDRSDSPLTTGSDRAFFAEHGRFPGPADITGPSDRDRALAGADARGMGAGDGTWGPDDFVVGNKVSTAYGTSGTVTGITPDGLRVTYDGTAEYTLPWDDVEDNLSAGPVVLPPGYGTPPGAYYGFDPTPGPPPFALEAPPTAASTVAVKDYEGEVGNSNHITRGEKGTLPTRAVARLSGVRGEVPGEHRNRLGAKWDAFLADIKANGIREPIFVTVDHGADPKISEGNHRRDAAVELGLPEVPVEIRYFGHAEQQGTVLDRAPAGNLTGTAGVRYDDPVPRLRDDSPTVAAPLEMPMSFDGELDLFGAPPPRPPAPLPGSAEDALHANAWMAATRERDRLQAERDVAAAKLANARGGRAAERTAALDARIADLDARIADADPGPRPSEQAIRRAQLDDQYANLLDPPGGPPPPGGWRDVRDQEVLSSLNAELAAGGHPPYPPLDPARYHDHQAELATERVATEARSVEILRQRVAALEGRPAREFDHLEMQALAHAEEREADARRHLAALVPVR